MTLLYSFVRNQLMKPADMRVTYQAEDNKRRKQSEALLWMQLDL